MCTPFTALHVQSSWRAAGLVVVMLAIGCGPTVEVQRSAPAHRTTGRTFTVAVADFEGGSIPPNDGAKFWQRALALNLLADLRASDALRPVERHRLVDVLREQRLSASALGDPNTQLRIGNILGAQLFVFGTYLIVAGVASVTARLVDVETGRILASEKVEGRFETMAVLAKQLSVALLRSLDHDLVADMEPQRDGTGRGQSVEALRWFSEGLDCEDRGRFDEAVDMYAKALGVDPSYEEARTRLEQASEAAARR